MLKLTLTQRALLQDLEPFNSTKVDTVYDDNNSIVDQTYECFDAGKKVLDASDTITLEPNFNIRFIYIESLSEFDIELHQPEIDRTGIGGPIIAPSVIQQNDCFKLYMQYGIFEKIVIKGVNAGNAIKYFLLGNK